MPKIPGFGKNLGFVAILIAGLVVERVLTRDRGKTERMKTKIWGMVVSVLGIIGLLTALLFMNTADGMKHLLILFVGGFLGTVAFFAGIRMFPRS